MHVTNKQYLFTECYYVLKFDILDPSVWNNWIKSKLWIVIMNRKLLKCKDDIFTGEQTFNWALRLFVFWLLNVRFCFPWETGYGGYVYSIY